MRARMILGVAAVAGLALGLPALAEGAPKGDAIVLRLGTTAPEGSPYLEGVLRMSRHAEKATGNAISVRVVASGLLGSENDMVEALRHDRLDAWCGSVGAAVAAVPELAALELPFLFRDEAEVDRAIPAIYTHATGASRERGLTYLGFTHVGFRHLGTKVPVGTLADLRKLRLRSQPNPVHAELWKALGVRHVQLGLPDVPREFEAGTVDAFDSAVVWMFAAGWHVLVKHVTRTAHIYQPGSCLLGAAAGARLPKAVLKKLERAFALDALRTAELGGCVNCATARKIERELLETLPGMGVAVHDEPALRAATEKLAEPVRASWRKAATPRGRAFLDAVVAAVAKGRRGQ